MSKTASYVLLQWWISSRQCVWLFVHMLQCTHIHISLALFVCFGVQIVSSGTDTLMGYSVIDSFSQKQSPWIWQFTVSRWAAGLDNLTLFCQLSQKHAYKSLHITWQLHIGSCRICRLDSSKCQQIVLWCRADRVTIVNIALQFHCHYVSQNMQPKLNFIVLLTTELCANTVAPCTFVTQSECVYNLPVFAIKPVMYPRHTEGIFQLIVSKAMKLGL